MATPPSSFPSSPPIPIYVHMGDGPPIKQEGANLYKMLSPSHAHPEGATDMMIAIATRVVRISVKKGFITGGDFSLDEEDIQNRINRDLRAFMSFQTWGTRTEQATTIKGAAQNLHQYGKLDQASIDQYVQFHGYRLTWEERSTTIQLSKHRSEEQSYKTIKGIDLLCPEGITGEMLEITSRVMRILVAQRHIMDVVPIPLDEEIQNRINQCFQNFLNFQAKGMRIDDATLIDTARNLNQCGELDQKTIDRYVQFHGYYLTWDNKHITHITRLTHASELQ